MKHSRHRHNFFSIVVIAFLLAVVVPTTAFGQGRGRGHGRGGIFGSSHNKCGKFVNCHDARDGRWDGRGPRGNRVSNIMLRNRIRRHRNRNFDNDLLRDRRFRNGDRDFLRNRRGWRRHN